MILGQELTMHTDLDLGPGLGLGAPGQGISRPPSGNEGTNSISEGDGNGNVNTGLDAAADVQMASEVDQVLAAVRAEFALLSNLETGSAGTVPLVTMPQQPRNGWRRYGTLSYHASAT